MCYQGLDRHLSAMTNFLSSDCCDLDLFVVSIFFVNLPVDVLVWAGTVTQSVQ